MKVKQHTREQQLVDCLTEQGLFVPPTTGAREAIHSYIHGGKKRLSDGTFDDRVNDDRVNALKQVTGEFKGQLLMHRKIGETLILFDVQYVLPKTPSEMKRHTIGWGSDRTGKLKIQPINPFKVCVTSPRLPNPCTLMLDMLVVVRLTVAPQQSPDWSVRRVVVWEA